MSFITTNHVNFIIFPAKIRLLSNQLKRIRLFVGQIRKKTVRSEDARHAKFMQNICYIIKL